jgi:oligopeptidase B
MIDVLKPPATARHDHIVHSPHGDRIDPYYWLRDDSRSDPAVIGYLEAENAYLRAAMAHVRPFEDELFTEIVARIRQDDESVPVLDRDYWYVTRYALGAEYPLYLRRADRDGEGFEIILDVNQLAAGCEYCHVGGLEVSPDNRLLTYAQDTIGRRQYTLRIKDLATGELLADEIPNATTDIAWSNDSRSFFYVERHPVTLLDYRVRRHVLGTEPRYDVLVYEERDESFSLGVERSKDQRFILISAESTVSTEWRFLDADRPAGEFEIFLERERDHEYEIEPFGARFLILSNWQAPNFRILEVPIDGPRGQSHWREIVPHDPAGFIHDFDVFREHLVISERSGGLRRLRIRPWNGGGEYVMPTTEPASTALLDDNPAIDTTVLRYTYTSLTTPATTYDFDMLTGEQRLLKRDAVLGDFDPGDYRTEHLWLEARGGASVPVSVVHRDDVPLDGSAPLYVYAYGAYGISIDPTFRSTRLTLLDRGFVYAIAHVRGGQELGRAWYDAGRLEHKMNTFTDFIDVVRGLLARGYGASDKVFAMGGSAGGLLMGVVANLAPALFRGVVAHVPFVDIVTTMLDDSIPLTTLEYDEWGDPAGRRYYDLMLSYSPYDNVVAQDYPAMLVTTGLWDSQVQFWEPAKWVAKLRALKTDRKPLYLRTTMEAGHGGKSGRFEQLREVAEEYAFVLTVLADTPL